MLLALQLNNLLSEYVAPPVQPAVGTTVENTNSTTDVPDNIVICQRSNFKLFPDEIVRDGYGLLVRKQSRDFRHPQERVRAKQDKQRGSISPEQDDRFLADGEITTDDL